jgi:hypothetical protein
MSYVVELQEGCWLKSGEGDPPRTLDIRNAKVYRRRFAAEYGLKKARECRPFRSAKVVELPKDVPAAS